MFPVKLDHASPEALHEQVAAQIRRAIADGEAGPGERLPLAKDIAAVLGVNKNTVLRALHQLAGDWSSDVCSSDLCPYAGQELDRVRPAARLPAERRHPDD